MKKLLIIFTLVILSACKPGVLLDVEKGMLAEEKSSCKEHLAANSLSTNGFYAINHDKNVLTPKISVYCDMTGGGWTRIIRDHTTSLAELSKFGDTSELIDTFYSDPVMGIGWGENAVTGGINADCRFSPKFILQGIWDYTEIKLTVSGAAAVATDPDNSVGYLYLSNNMSDLSIRSSAFVDAWGADASGANTIVDGSGNEISPRIYTDLLAFTYTLPLTGRDLLVCLGGEAPYAYNKRYINAMWIK